MRLQDGPEMDTTTCEIGDEFYVTTCAQEPAAQFSHELNA